MKSIALLSVLAAGSLVAGEKTPILEKSPIAAASPNLYSWFAGATAGYLTENDTEMYTGHLGIDLPHQFRGWDQSLYLEVGYFELDEHIVSNTGRNTFIAEGPAKALIIDGPIGSYPCDLSELTGNAGEKPSEPCGPYGNSALAGALTSSGWLDIEMAFIPVTLNYKLEKAINPTLNVFFGLGAGAAFIDADVDNGFASDSDDDTVFFAQLFGGVLHNISPTFEVFAGVRVIYFEDPEFTLYGSNVDLDDFSDVGFDVETTDVLVELGGRINF